MSYAIRTLALTVAFFAITGATRAEIIVQNDSLPPVGVISLGLTVGTRIDARLTSPIDGVIVGVQILWGSQSGLAAPSQEAAIRISAFDVNPWTPAATLATILSPTLIDGAVNEYRFLDPTTNLIPLAIPITANTDFFVDLEIAHFYNGFDPNSPGVLMDADGFAFARNGIHFPGGAIWGDYPLGVQHGGDFGIRAIIQPVPEPSTYALAAMGVIALLAVRRQKA